MLDTLRPAPVATRILGVPVRQVAPGVFAGRISAQLAVNAAQGPSGWRVTATDLRTDETIAFGIGATLQHAEEDAQDDFIGRMNRAARRTRRRAVELVPAKLPAPPRLPSLTTLDEIRVGDLGSEASLGETVRPARMAVGA